MIRLIILTLILLSSLYAKDDIDKKITKTSSKLSSFSKSYLSINKKMAKNAKAILRQKRELNKQNKFLATLKNELKEKESSYKASLSQLTTLKTYQGKLTSDQSKIEEELVFRIAQSVSLSVILDERSASSEESLIEFEVLKSMLKTSKDKVSALNEKFFTNSKDIDLLAKQTKSLETVIATIEEKRRDLLKTQKANELALIKLKKDKKSYKKELKHIISQQNLLKNTLAKLNIIKIDEINKDKEEKERKEAFAHKKIDLSENLPKVKKHGTSYQSVKTKKYRGVKTIAPLDDYMVSKKYGAYTDPIYGIKIFNESISLKPKFNNAKVKTVFNGKVIYADKTAVLDNIVIVEHTNGLHTIYANLSQISPNIRQGKKIKKGYTIGRVKDELIFEVTQKSYHINPIRLFQ